MVSDEERIRRFVRKTLSQADLSTLTLAILRGRYLEHVGGVALSTEQRELLKRVVKAELLNMQNNQSESERSESAATGETPHTQLKRKRDEEEEVITMAKMKKSRVDKSPEIQRRRWEEGKRDLSGGEEEEEEEGKRDLSGGEEEEVEEGKRDLSGGEEEEEEEGKRDLSGGEEEEEQTSDEEVEPQERKQKEKRGMKSVLSSSDSEEEKPLVRHKSDNQSEEEEEEEESSDEGEKPVKKEQRDGAGPGTGGAFPGDSDSSSLPSLDDEEEEVEKPKEKVEPKEKAGLKERKKKSDSRRKKQEERVTREGKEEDKSVSRLKRYIALCGARRNYKKLLDGCKSVRAKVAVLKNELEELGVHGKPSIDKCKKARLKREEAQELAELDMSNIITTEGRPQRRAAAPGMCVSTPCSVSRRRVESDSDSDSQSTRGPRRTTDWSRLRGIISDEDSD